MRFWVEATKKDHRYADLLLPARPTIVHRTTGRLVGVSVSVADIFDQTRRPGEALPSRGSEAFKLPNGTAVTAKRLTDEAISLCRERITLAIDVLEDSEVWPK